jgi:osmoprotectant transport system permease protein
MNLLREALSYIEEHPERFRDALFDHVRLSVVAVLLAVLLFVPLGIFASRSRRFGPTIVNLVGAARVLPSLVIIFLLYPLIGLGDRPALIALMLLAGPPLMVNTDAGLRNVDPAVIESARGLGMTPLQIFWRVQLPLALPVMIAGLRTATVEVIASATLAAFIGAGGLGRFILSGVTLVDWRLLLVGAIPVTLLALLAEALLGGLERFVSPPRA